MAGVIAHSSQLVNCVAALYDPPATQAHVDTNINYEDGRAVRIQMELRVMGVGDE